MEKKQRTSITNSSPPCPKEAAAGLDPLVQTIDDHDHVPIYMRRQSSVFYVPANIINGNEDEKKSSNIRKCCIFMGRFSGILYALLASFLFTCSNFVLKQLNVNLLDVVIIRCFVQGFISILFIIYKDYHLFPDSNRILVMIRSSFAAAGTITFFYCLSLLPLADLTTLRYTQVVWTALLAMIIFRERINLPTILACILTLIGVICVAQPTYLFRPPRILNETISETLKTKNQQRLFGMLLALSCALSISMSIVLNKKLIQKKVQQSLIMFYYLFITLIVLLIIRIHYWAFSKSKEQEFDFQKIFLTKAFLLASIITISQLIPMILSQKAIKREHPSIITVVQSSDILFAVILENIFSSIRTNLLALMGSTLVLTSIFIVGGHKLWLDRENRTFIPIEIQENLLKMEIKQ